MCVAGEICEIGEGGGEGGKWKKGDKVGGKSSSTLLLEVNPDEECVAA